MATGLLILGAGQGTRLLTHLVGLGKTYSATIRLGQATTTDDAEGEALGEATAATGLTDEQLEAALDALRGDIAQVPSAVSAIKVDGQRAYARVRAGEDVQLDARPVTISRFDVLARREDGLFCDLDVVVDCSSALGVGGHLTALRRTHIGPFSVEEAATVPPRGQDDVSLPLRGLGEAAGRTLPTLVLDEAAATDLGHGKRPRVPAVVTRMGAAGTGAGADALVAALDGEGRLVAVAAVEQSGHLRPVLVIPPGART